MKHEFIVLDQQDEHMTQEQAAEEARRLADMTNHPWNVYLLATTIYPTKNDK